MGCDKGKDEANVRFFVYVALTIFIGLYRWPGMLDTSVGGGITAGMTPFEAIIKESMEEGSISEEVVRRHAKAVGAVSYFCR